MTDTTPAGTPAPKRTPATKTSPAAKAPIAKAPAAKTPVAKPAAAKAAPAVKTPAAKAPAAQATTPKVPVAKAPAAKTPAAKTPAPKIPAVKTAAVKTPAAKAATATTVGPVEATPSTVAAPSAAVAPAGWYPVAAGSAQQRWWDGAQWTEHVYETPAATGVEPLRAAAGVKPGTVWFWLLAVGVPILTLLDLIPTSIYVSQVLSGATADPTAAASAVLSPAYLLVLLSGWFIDAVSIVFGLLDWRELNARGVPKPFHWAWGFFVIAVGWPAVYVIGRSVVVKRRTGAGLAPLWVFIGLEVVVFIVSLVVVVVAIVQLISITSDLLSVAGNVL